MRPRPDPVGPGQDSVWAYPRPPIAQRIAACVRIDHAGVVVADIAPGLLQRAGGGSFCEWKGEATYWDVVIGTRVMPRVGWSYARPTPPFDCLRDHVAFYAGPFDRCSVEDETVTPQAGGFYGGWITSGLAGPFKGGPGSRMW